MKRYAELVRENGWSGAQAPAPHGYDQRVMEALNAFDRGYHVSKAAGLCHGIVEDVTVDGRIVVAWYDCPIEALGISFEDPRALTVERRF